MVFISKKTAAAIMIVFILGAFAGYFYGAFQQAQSSPATIPVQTTGEPAKTPAPATIESSATINLVAIDNSGNGVAMPLKVQKRAGYGETLININNLVFWFDTQQSIQTARSVAENITGVDASGINLVYMIDANATMVEGPSAGAALTIATIAALENKSPSTTVMITGTINPDGTIGQVGGILEKAAAAKQAGAKLFLVPEGQGTENRLQPVENCTVQDYFTYCTTRYRQITTDISSAAGITMKEVSTIADAEKYFFS